MPRKSPYPPEVRERAVKMFVEHRDEYPSEWAAMTGISAKLGMTRRDPAVWVRRAEVDQGRRPGLTTDERQRLKELERENPRAAPRQRDLEGRVDFLRDRARRSNEEVVRYIDARKGRWGVEPICRALQFAPATYYAARSPASRAPGASVTRS